MPSIEVTSLRKQYGDLKAVDDISFTVKNAKSSVYSVQTAAGKTTTIEIIEGSA